MDYHIPVLLKESLEGLSIKSDGCYLDLTFGGGGHSKAILLELGDSGRLVGFDRDEDAMVNIPNDDRFLFVNHNFSFVRNFVKYYNLSVDGILADLGVSSHEFDVADRGFSFRFDADLDMRMSRKTSITAVDILNTYDLDSLCRIFNAFGEIENSFRLSNTIIAYRNKSVIRKTSDLYSAIEEILPKRSENKYLAKLYQALRIEVNGELDALIAMLESSVDILKKGGRLVVITYHSLEDRIVKNFMKFGNIEGKENKDPIYGNVFNNFKIINRKVITPSDDEIINNSRGRSAKLRIAEKI